MLEYRPNEPLYPQSDPDDSVRDGMKVLKYFVGGIALFALGVFVLLLSLLGWR